MSLMERPVWVRLAFVAAVCALPLQVVIRDRLSEPYPGIYQPSFGDSPPSAGVARTVEPAVTVVDSDGTRTSVASADLLPPTRVLNTAVFRAAFYRPGPAEQPETQAWLRARILALRPGTDPETVEIQWQDVERSYQDGTRTVVAQDRLTLVAVDG